MAPEFSLIIPTYNRREALVHCLRHLEALRFPRRGFEVLLVDDGSTDGTEEVAHAPWNLALRVLRQANGGASAARNAGILAATGQFCMFVDDDVLVHPDLLSEHQEAHRAWPNLLVRGPVINIPALPCPTTPPPLWRHYSRNYLCTSNASLNREFLLEAGLFDTTFPRWEDAELGVRLKSLGVQRRFQPRALVYHLKPPETLESLLRTAAADGRSAASLYRRYPSLSMRLRSGLHPLNLLRNGLLTAGPLLEMVSRSARGEGPLPEALARSLLVEREYLRAGMQELRQESPSGGQNAAPAR